MKTNAIFSAEGRLNTKQNRIQDFRKAKNISVPESYKVNSTKEELCMEYVKSFIDEFTTLHPKRKTPFMIAENECGVKKFVCSTLRPTQLNYSELYDMHECAVFLAGYILYEPLNPPTEAPSIMPSPNQVLAWHTGDSFDMAFLLCSILCGNGYDAYVVQGYAPNYITLRDQSATQCPLISKLSEDVTTKHDRPEQDVNDVEENPFIVPDNALRESKFIESEIEKRRLDGLDAFVLWRGEVDRDEPDAEDSPTNLVHAWVLVRAGPRDVQDNVFIEPTTGRVYSPMHSPYFGIEALWNKSNYWINMQPNAKMSELDFDLNDNSKWEFLFITPVVEKHEDNHLLRKASTSVADDLMIDQPPPKQEAVATATSEPIERTLDPPTSWAKPITLERQSYLLRYPPSGRRTVQYCRAKVDYFAKNKHPQAMVMRIITYLDRSHTQVKEIHEWFENRRDKLYKRVRHVLDGKFVEHFFPGSVGEVKQWVEYPGKRRDIDFYVSGRLDRMYRREETIGEKIVELFEGRTDYLNFRSVWVTLDRSKAGNRSSYMLPGGGLENELFVLKIHQTFDRNPNVPSGTDIATRTFFIPEGRVVTHFHFAAGKITQNIKVYNHAKSSGVGLTGHADELSSEDIEGIHEAALIERECFAAVKLSYAQLLNIIKLRNEFEASVIIEKTVFELALERAEKGITGATDVEAEADGDAKGIDYLTPFLRGVRDVGMMSKEEALEVRQACLDSLKARLVERANIIQSRLNEENAKLARKQEQFQRSQREGDLSTEEYEKYCTEAMFRIQILEQRLVAHEEAALKKFSDLDMKLAADPRLRILRNQ